MLTAGAACPGVSVPGTVPRVPVTGWQMTDGPRLRGAGTQAGQAGVTGTAVEAAQADQMPGHELLPWPVVNGGVG